MGLDINNLKPIAFDWDQNNKFKNKKKHNVSFKECEQVFFNYPLKTFFDKKHSVKENRFLVFGQTDEYRKLIVVFTIRKKKIRIISARDMSKKERRFYGKKEE